MNEQHDLSKILEGLGSTTVHQEVFGFFVENNPGMVLQALCQSKYIDPAIIISLSKSPLENVRRLALSSPLLPLEIKRKFLFEFENKKTEDSSLWANIIGSELPQSIRTEWIEKYGTDTIRMKPLLMGSGASDEDAIQAVKMNCHNAVNILLRKSEYSDHVSQFILSHHTEKNETLFSMIVSQKNASETTLLEVVKYIVNTSDRSFETKHIIIKHPNFSLKIAKHILAYDNGDATLSAILCALKQKGISKQKAQTLYSLVKAQQILSG